jgi:hypothetical protein
MTPRAHDAASAKSGGGDDVFESELAQVNDAKAAWD